MVSILAQMGLLILCGIGWRIIRPGGFDADQTRVVLTTLVFNLLMPALTVSVLWKTAVGLETLRISVYGLGVISLGIGITWTLSRVIKLDDRRLGAALLAVGFPNVTYLGLPLLEQIFGPWARAIVIQIDLFAATPAVLVLGAMIGRRYGERDPRRAPTWTSALNNPPLWAAAVGVTLNQTAVPIPSWLDQTLERLAAAVIPAMLISLGLGLTLRSWQRRNLPWALLVMAARLFLIPWLALRLGMQLGFSGDRLTALTLEAAMPSMLFGVVFCDRYRLDTGFYAMVVALTTLACAFSLPFWQIAASRF